MLIRSRCNYHRYIRFINNRIELLQTHEKDPPGLLKRLGGLFLTGLATAGILMGLLCGNPGSAWAELPSGYQTVSGSATFQQAGNTLNINASNKAIINYQRFNIGHGETVNIFSPLSLHRVIGGNPSEILGNLNSTGKVFLINPSGIIFGQGTQVNVQGLVASTLQIKDDDFLAGKYAFQRAANTPAGAIVNHGQLLASESLALLGASVQNTGQLQAPSIQVAVGDTMTYFLSPEVAIDVKIGQSLKQKVDGFQAAIANSGQITGETIKLQAKLAQSFYESTVNNTGIIKAHGLSQNAAGEIIAIGQSDDQQAFVYNTGALIADGVSNGQSSAHGGTIRLEGDTTINTGTLSALGATGGIGGNVVMLGNTVQSSGNATIDVSGDHGGGTILLGGDYQGKNSDIRNALYNYSTPTVRLFANALTQGNGGKVILWADKKTVFQGNIEARGGSLGGNGGFVETSGKEILQAFGSVDARSPLGQNGQWLLDPNNITIQTNAPDLNIGASGTNPLLLESTNDNAVVTSQTIQDALNNGTDVTIQTSNAGSHAQDGTIQIASSTLIDKTTGTDATLTLKAHHSIIIDNSIIRSTGNGHRLNVVLNADTDQGTGGGIGGAIKVASSTINTNDGNITMGGGANPLTSASIGTSQQREGVVIDVSTINAGAGTISIRGLGASAPGDNNQVGVLLKGGSQILTTTGDISIEGRGGNGTGGNRGILMDGNGVRTTVQTQDGDISMVGYGGNGSDNSNHGISLENGGQIISTGHGSVTVTGTGGNGISDNNGIFMDGITGLVSDTKISAAAGNLTVTGYGGIAATGNSNRGVKLTNGGNVMGTGTATVTLSGTGGGGTNNNDGLFLDGYSTNTTISSQTGNLTVTGIGGNGTTDNNRGIVLANGGQIKTTGAATLTVNGTGGGQTSDNHGIMLDGNNNTNFATQITAVSGNVSVTGQGGGSSSNNNHGIFIHDGGQITSTGSANVLVSGIKGAGNSSSIQVNNGNNILGSNLMTGNLSLRADDFNLSNVLLRTAGKVFYQPYTNNLSMGLNGGAGTLQFGNAFINLIDRNTVSPSAIAFGNPTAANNAVTINNWDLSSYNLPLEVYGGTLVTNSINTGSGSLLLRALTGNLTINNGAVLTSSASGNAIVLAAGQDFINNAAIDTALSASNGRWLVYSSNPATTTEGFSAYTKRYNRTFAGNSPASITENGNVMLYSVAPTITVAADNASRDYGSGNPTFTSTITANLIDGDTLGAAYNGSAAYSTTGLNSNAGSYALTPTVGTLASALGYTFVYTPGTLTVNPIALSITANDATRSQGANNPAFSAFYSGFALGEDESVLNGSLSLTTLANNASTAGTYAITAGGTLSSPNYTISLHDGTLTVLPPASPPPSSGTNQPPEPIMTVPYLLSPTQTPNTVTPAALQQQALQPAEKTQTGSDEKTLVINSTQHATATSHKKETETSSLKSEGLLYELLVKRYKAAKRKPSF